MIKAGYTPSQILYVYLKEFQKRRLKMMEDYDLAAKRLKRFEGSSGFVEDMNKLQKKLENDLKALQTEYRPKLQRIFERMEAAVDGRKMDPPEGWMVNMLQILRMKENVTSEDLDKVAESVKECGLALDVVDEIAKKHGILRSYSTRGEMSSKHAREIIRGLRSGAEDFLQHDTTRSARIAAERHADLYNANIGPLRKRPVFDTAEGCYLEIGGISGDSLAQFRKIVDAENGSKKGQNETV